MKTVWVKAETHYLRLIPGRKGEIEQMVDEIDGTFWLKFGEKRFHLSQGLADVLMKALSAGHSVRLEPAKEGE